MIYGTCLLLLLVSFAQSQKVDGGWSQWSGIDCTIGCGNRFERETRSCTNPEPQNGGKQCIPPSIRSRFCYGPRKCPIDGGWSQWSKADCTIGCGNRFERERRTCTNPAPQHGGKQCPGQKLRSFFCYGPRKCSTSDPSITDAGTSPLPETTQSPSTPPAPTNPPTTDAETPPLPASTQSPTSPPEPTTWSPPYPPAPCGQVHVKTSRVIGGVNAIHGAWPWQVALYYTYFGTKKYFICGGSLISDQWIVTAAHCTYMKKAGAFFVRTGEHDRSKDEGTEHTYAVERIFDHEKFHRAHLYNDIALMKLKTPVVMGKYVSPVCLPTAPVATGTKCYITGWGKIKHPGGSHKLLQEAALKVVDQKTCYNLNTVKSRSLQVNEQMICAGNGNGTITSGCHGDSGGPFVCESKDGFWELHGAVSWGNPRCDVSKAYTVFAKITHYITWIADKVNSN